MNRRRFKIGLAVLAVLFVITWVAGCTAARLIPLPERLSYGDSVVVTYENGRPAHVLLSDDDKWRFPTRIDDVDPAYLEALVAYEDKRFYSHGGVDFIAIVRAFFDNARAGTTVSGASTITMQLVRLLEPRPRTLRSKSIEALRAMQLERYMSKDEILEAYLRFAPFGGNIEGVEAATLSFWGRLPSGLSSAEIATLLAIPQSPTARRPSPRNRDTLREARDDIAMRLAEVDAIPRSQRPDELARELKETEVPEEFLRLPRDIPHVVEWLKANRPDVFERDEAGRGSPSVRIETTLDGEVQERIARIVSGHERRLRATGAPHAAVVVMESETGKLRGIVGNLDFELTSPGSHLPAFDSPRSTGSLLKPVVYAAALDEGIVAPSHELLDVPIVRGDYKPQNFDRRFRGLVEAEVALAMSLNIPFVRLLEQLTVEEFIQTLVRFGVIEPVRRAGSGGLELVIGGMPASAIEVATLYAGFARGGFAVEPQIYNVELQDNGEQIEEHRAVSEAAVWLTKRALTRRPTPWMEVGSRRARDEGFVWKTGTSYSYHDAWTAGFGAEYTVVVWAGDLGFHRHPELVGADVAAPIFFEVADAIDRPHPLRSTQPADQLASIEVCSRSGRRPGPHCHNTVSVLAPAKSAAPERCNFHVEITVDADTGRRLPDGCRPDDVTQVESKVVVKLPDLVAHYNRSRGRRSGGMPDIHPGCEAEHGATLAIASPREQSTVILEPHRPAEMQVVRLEAHSSIGSRLHWYINGRHIESAPAADAVYWTPEPGQWTIAVVDERGTRDTRELTVGGSLIEIVDR